MKTPNIVWDDEAVAEIGKSTKVIAEEIRLAIEKGEEAAKEGKKVLNNIWDRRRRKRKSVRILNIWHSLDIKIRETLLSS